MAKTDLSFEERAREAERFLWHFAELAIVLMVGMFVVSLASGLALFGDYSLLSRSNPEMFSITMVLTNTVLMVVWLGYRHYSLTCIREIALGMSGPALLLVAGSSIGLLPQTSLLVGANVLVWAGMLSAMLYRKADYSHHLPQERHVQLALGQGKAALPRIAPAASATVQVQKIES